MKRSIYKNSAKQWLLFLVVIMSSSTLSAKDYTKEILRNFKVNADAKFVVDNNKGNISITTWDKNTIKIEVEIIVKAKDATQAEEFFKQIKIDFEKNSGYVKATTSKEKETQSWRDWIWGSTQNMNWNVHYKIIMPKTNTLSVSNKFGDVYVSSLKGDASINVKYGNFKLSNFDNLRCDLAYGEGTISEVKNLIIDIKYGDIRLRNAKNIDIISKYSEIDIDEASEIRSNSKYDDFEIGTVTDLNSTGRYDDFQIGKVGTINAAGKHSDFKIESILKSGDFNLEYGEVIIDNLAVSVEKIKLIGQYTEFIIDTEGGTFNLVVDGDATDIETPANMNTTSEERDNNVLKLKGKVGTGSSNTLIEVRTKYGSLKIIQR
jgi:hypothetical protein